jgi:hypothetical protein
MNYRRIIRRQKLPLEIRHPVKNDRRVNAAKVTAAAAAM